MNTRKAPPVIALLTDFGTRDHFVGVMKGVIAGICPRARIIDLSHDIEPQNVAQGAFVLHVSRRYFPSETVFVCVVDPGVGTERRPVAVRAGGSWFVGPDNGLLYPEWESRTPLTDDAIVELDNPEFWQEDVSGTFHGRDIFAPVAAHLASGVAATQMGAYVTDLVGLSIAKPKALDDETTQLEVLHVDRFGNLVTNMRSDALPDQSDRVVFSIGGVKSVGVQTNFASSEALIAVAGSSGYIELAAPGGSAAEDLDAGLGATVIMRFGDGV